MPSYNPNNRARLTGAQLRNRVITDLFEPGSTLKPFTVALALEIGKVTPRTRGAHRPGPAHPRPTTPFATCTPRRRRASARCSQRSSNVGAAKIALRCRARRCGTFSAASASAPRRELGFPGAAAGQLRPYKTWRPIEQATMAYGHGISLSLVQLARAYTVFARDGELVPLTLVKTGTAVSGKSSVGRDGARGARDARAGGAARRHRPARPRHGMAGGRQDRHRAQAGERRIRSPTSISRPSSASRRRQRAAPGGRGDARRAFGRAALRRRGRSAGVLADHAGRPAAAERAARRAARAAAGEGEEAKEST